MNALALIYVAIGGAIGSVARALAGHFLPVGRLPWATIIVNVTGSLLIGWLIARLAPTSEETLQAHSFWVVGVCGGFTTFSSFSWQTFDLLQKGNWGYAVANVLLSVVLCLLATWLGCSGRLPTYPQKKTPERLRLRRNFRRRKWEREV